VKSSIGQKIKTIRLQRELTQENIAYDLGITKGAYSKIERDATNVSINRLKAIAKILEVDIVDFFQDTDNKTEDSKNDYGFATKGDIEEIVKMIQSLAKEVSTLKASLPVNNSKPVKSKNKKA